MRKRRATELELFALGGLMAAVHVMPGAASIVAAMESRLKLDGLRPEYQAAIREIASKAREPR